MHLSLMRKPAPQPARFAHVHARPPATCPDHCDLSCGANHQFETMLDAYQPTGGIAKVEEVVELFAQRDGPDVPTLADWIERREVICFPWHADIWLPWFQFNRLDLKPHAALGPVFAELNLVYDPWEVGNWFARPNPWLGGRVPVATLVADLPAVWDAAHADRLIAHG
jgi:hypothetical protein